jgi:regulator of protease activity HflC (stomatin/prohibitin superfamily)
MKQSYKEERKMFKSIRKKIIFGVIALIVLILVFSSFTIVNAGFTGVKITLGSVSATTLDEGLHFKIPFVQSIKEMDNRVQKLEADCASASKDLQTIHSKIAVNIRLDDSASASIYKNVGMDYGDKVLNPSIQEVVKAITAKHTAEELITKRQDASVEMKDLLQAKIKEYGLTVDNFNIVNFSFSDEFNSAIESKQIAQQQALKANLDLQRIEIEAKQKVAQAKAEAESLRLQKQEITPELLQLRQIEVMKEKWNGQLPTTVYIGDGNGEQTLLGIPIK